MPAALQRALSFAASVRALQQSRGWSHEVCCRILQWRSSSLGSSRLHHGASSSPGGPSTPRPSARPAARASELGVAAAEAQALPQPAVPLCERDGRHAVPLADLLEWREAAQRQVAAVGDSWVAQDGPSAEELQTELSWLLDDTLTALAHAGGDWRPVTWRQLERDLQTEAALQEGACQHLVQLREPLEALEVLWDERLQRRVPLQYLTSSVFWRDVVLSVGPGVLIPRPETELVIDFVEEAVAAAPQLAAGAWADLGTGSGALAVGVARALPQAERVYAVDLSPTPLAYASFNARRLGVADRLTPLQGSWYEPLQAAGVQQLAGIVSNPPYIPSAEMPGLQAEVGRHEPQLALHGGEGLGVDCLLPICTGAARLLQPGGFLALETAGGEQAHYIADVLRHLRRGVLSGGAGAGSAYSLSASSAAWDSGSADDEQLAFEDVRVRKDLRGIDRFVTATAAAPPPQEEGE